MQHRERIALEKICAEIDLALKFVENVNSEEFLVDEKTKRAVGMTAINIGELTKHLTMEFREKYPQVEWKSAARFRDIVAHKYETLNMLDVYETVTKDFPEMKFQIEKILEQ